MCGKSNTKERHCYILWLEMFGFRFQLTEHKQIELVTECDQFY